MAGVTEEHADKRKHDQCRGRHDPPEWGSDWNRRIRGVRALGGHGYSCRVDGVSICRDSTLQKTNVLFFCQSTKRSYTLRHSSYCFRTQGCCPYQWSSRMSTMNLRSLTLRRSLRRSRYSRLVYSLWKLTRPLSSNRYTSARKRNRMASI